MCSACANFDNFGMACYDLLSSVCSWHIAKHHITSDKFVQKPCIYFHVLLNSNVRGTKSHKMQFTTKHFLKSKQAESHCHFFKDTRYHSSFISVHTYSSEVENNLHRVLYNFDGIYLRISVFGYFALLCRCISEVNIISLP